MFDSLRPHGLQHARPSCLSPTPGACSNSCPSSKWCHPTISSSVIPFSSCLQSFPASGSFQWISSSQQVAKILEFQLQYSISPSSEYSGLISFRIDWFDLLQSNHNYHPLFFSLKKLGGGASFNLQKILASYLKHTPINQKVLCKCSNQT